MLLGVEAGSLVPRVTVDMADHPYIIHCVARSRNLLVVVAVGDRALCAVGALENVVSFEACAEALRRIELIVINLGLRMMVRRIARPSARLVEHLAHYHVGIRGIVIVEHR